MAYYKEGWAFVQHRIYSNTEPGRRNVRQPGSVLTDLSKTGDVPQKAMFGKLN